MLAIISDTHGNLVALKAVLADANKLGVSQFICLGDVASFGPKPKETLDLVKSLDCPIVLGNTDAYLLKPRTKEDVVKITKETPMHLEIETWCAEQLTTDDKKNIDFWPMNYQMNYESTSILMFHGSPSSYHDIIVASTDGKQVEKYLKGFSADLFLHGHTHTQYVRKCKASRILNPGSVGLPFINGVGSSPSNPTFAEYAILQVEQGQANISFRRVVYSLTDLKISVKESSMPHQDLWLKNWEQA